MFSVCMITAVTYILGILLSHTIGMSAIVSIFIGMLVVFLVRLIRGKENSAAVLLLAFIFIFGGARYFSVSENRLYYEFPEKYVTVTGVISSSASQSTGTYKYRYILKAETISYLDTAYEINHKIIINTQNRFDYGDRITASGFLSEIEGINNEYEYDYSLHYKSRGIYARLIAREADKIGEHFSLNPVFLLGSLRSGASRIIESSFHGNTAALLKTIIVGDKTGFSDDYLNLLIRTGVYRSLYAPFVHIILIFLLINLFMGSKRKKWRDLAAILMLLGYAFINGSSPTALKAALVVGLVLMRKSLFGFADKLDTLSVIVLSMTLIDPLLCFNSGFMMSVISTYMVYISFPVLYPKVQRIFAKRRVPFRRLGRILVLWIIFLIGMLPFCAYYFNGISVYSVFITPLLMPLIFAVILLSPFMLLSFAIFGSAPLIGDIVSKIIYIIKQTPYVIQHLPFCYMTIRTPTILFIIIFCLLWWIFLKWLKSQLNTNTTKILVTIASALVIVSASNYEFNTLSVNFVNVGQGDGAVLHTSAGETVLIDGGGSADYQTGYNVGERVFLPYLISHGFTDIDVAIVSHYHKDHVEGIIAAAENLRINALILPDSSPDNQYRMRLEEIARNRNIKTEYLMISDEIRFRSGLYIKFLAPDSSQLKSSDLNDTSLVAEVRYGDFCALFTGDSTDNFDETYPADIDLLKVAHHGSGSATFEEYANYVSPEFAVISVGKENSYGHPSSEVVRRLKEEGAHVLRTDVLGDIRFKINKNGKIKYSTLKGE